jgi:Rieske Fe-S protein
VDSRPAQQDYFCPCHDSNFALDGSLKKGVSPRDMDTLKVEIRKGHEVWVKFQRFKANTKEPIPIG